jgi:hypothetical protein
MISSFFLCLTFWYSGGSGGFCFQVAVRPKLRGSYSQPSSGRFSPECVYAVTSSPRLPQLPS